MSAEFDAKRLLRLSADGARINAAMLQLELTRYWENALRDPRYAEGKRLLRHGFKVYSQFDEDGLLQEIFRRVGTTNRRFCEFGVESGIECNTAKLLIEGWSGLWIEGNAKHIPKIRERFSHAINQVQLTLSETLVTVENINATIAAGGGGGDLDLLSIDIDGNDYWIWKAISVSNPRVVVIEYNATLRPPLSLVVPYSADRVWDGSNYFGASLEALVKLGTAKGYRIVGCGFTGANAYFVRDDLCGDSFHEPATAAEHYEPPRYFMSRLSAGHKPAPGNFERS